MGRPKVLINPIPGQRLKTIIDEVGISQTELAPKINMSQQSISKIVKGTSTLSEKTAELVINLYPQYRKAWLMGYDDMKTGADSWREFFKNSQDYTSLRNAGVQYLAKANDYLIDVYQLPEVCAVEDAMKLIKEGYTIKKRDAEATFSLDEMDALMNDISDYVDYKLNKLLTSKTDRSKVRTWRSQAGTIVEE